MISKGTLLIKEMSGCTISNSAKLDAMPRVFNATELLLLTVSSALTIPSFYKMEDVWINVPVLLQLIQNKSWSSIHRSTLRTSATSNVHLVITQTPKQMSVLSAILIARLVLPI